MSKNEKIATALMGSVYAAANHPWNRGIAFHPGNGDGYSGGGVGGDEFQDEPADFGDQGDESENFDPGFELEDDITLDPKNPLDSLYMPAEGEENPEPEQFDPGAGLPTQEQLTQELTDRIAGFSLPEDFIPDDYNPSDPRQVRELMANAGRHMIQAAVGSVFRPLQVAMESMQRELRNDIQQSVSGNNSAQQEQTILAKTIPAITDPALKSVVMTIFNQAKLRHPNSPQQAAIATRKAMIAAGMNPNGRKQEKQQQRGALAVLDSYAPMPPREPARRPASQVRDQLRR